MLDFKWSKTDYLEMIAYRISWRKMNRNFQQCTFGYLRPAKIQIRLRIRAVWSESSLGAFQIVKDAKFLQTDNEDSDQTSTCAGWFEPLLGVTSEGTFSDVTAQMTVNFVFARPVLQDSKAWFIALSNWSPYAGGYYILVIILEKGPFVMCEQ